jgi:hypothetical protein
MKLRVALLTAGLSPGDLSAAARRVSTGAKALFEFKEVIVLNAENLGNYCPEVKSRFGTLLNEGIRGYGYWAWKPEFVYRVIKGEFGDFDQIVWVDAGNEINSNSLTRPIFTRRIKKASETGYWLQALENSDLEYTKREVIEQYPNINVSDLSRPQIQANYFHLQGEIGIKIAEAWFLKTIEKVENTNLECDKTLENENFIEHRSDQSILSLVCKSMNLLHSKLNLPSGNSTPSIIRGIVQPIWISRNRTGKSIVPDVLRRIP